jgi:hypothetical protein
MGLLKRLFGKSRTQPALQTDDSPANGSTAILDQGEAFVFDLWKRQGRLVRQAVFWNARDEVSMVAFTNTASRDASLQELRSAAREVTPRRVFFFSASSATAPNGHPVDVIVLEVGDARLDFYGRRIYSAEEEPKRLAEETAPLRESTFAGMLGS